MEYKNLLSLFLPQGLLEHFDIEKVEQGKENNDLEFIHIHMIEKNTVPVGYDPGEYESKGFHRVRKLVDFPIRDKMVYLSIKRRRWRHRTDHNRTISNDYSHIADGYKVTAELAAFLKETRGDADRILKKYR
jgi:hypothetical protein